MMAGDLRGARDALLEATRAKDDDPAYWSSLGSVQVALKSYGDAYYAYSRAVELDRTNVAGLQTLADISLMSGQPDEAERLADQVELLQPGTIGPLLTKGFIALRRADYAAALKRADEALALSPQDFNAVVMKARALDGLDRPADAAALLEQRFVQVGAEESGLENLLTIYRGRQNVAGILDVQRRLHELLPDDKDRALQYAESLYDAGKSAEGREVTRRLAEGADAMRLLAILKLWLRFHPREEAVADVRALPPFDDPGVRFVLARFLVETGQIAEAKEILREKAALPVTAANANWVALMAHALDAEGDRAQALQLFNAVLTFDHTNIAALRGRTDLYLATGATTEAITDAQRLIAENPTSPEDRLRLARSYARAGNQRFAERTYWQAFNEIKGNPLLYGVLRRYLLRHGQGDRVASLTRTYRRQLFDLANNAV